MRQRCYPINEAMTPRRFLRGLLCNNRCPLFRRIPLSVRRTAVVIVILIYVSLIAKSALLVFPTDVRAMSNLRRQGAYAHQYGNGEERLEQRQTPFSRRSLALDAAQIQRQAMRRNHLQDVCRKLNSSGFSGFEKMLPQSLLQSIIVDDRYRLLYCRIPKVACTNWKRVLLTINGLLGANESYFDLPKTLLRRLTDYTTDEIRFRLDNYYKIVFVREPFERLVSAFSDKLIRTPSDAYRELYGKEIVRMYRKNPTNDSLRRGHDVSFDEFVSYLVDPRTAESGRPFDIHWRQYHELCRPCLIGYDFIGKYETLAEDADFVLKQLGVRKGVSFPRGPRRRVKTSDLVAGKFDSVSTANIHRLWKLYSIDFDMFNYSYPSFGLKKL